MIFPEQCKHVGIASGRPCGDRIYFLTRYLLHRIDGGYEILEVTPDSYGHGLMRDIVSVRTLASAGDITWYPEKVQLHDRTRLVALATESVKRCTIFTGHDEHVTFVLDPDRSGFLKIHIYDIYPPRPSLSACITELEAAGLFGELNVIFCHHVRDISVLDADVFPCRAAGFKKTLDADRMDGGERLVGCLTGSQFYTECSGKSFSLVNICPLEAVLEEPFIARCCRSEQEGIGMIRGRFGAVVHWGANPAQVARSVTGLVEKWRSGKIDDLYRGR